MIIGRKAEINVLHQAFQSENSSFVAIYGRRRVGKTFLVRETFGYRFTFQHAGLSEGKRKEQLYAFAASLKEAGFTGQCTLENWMEAFESLKDLIRASTEKKKVIFIDELSWMDTKGSDFMMALESFWNGWASARRDILLIVCASATSWILSKIVHNKGGLYNRLTDEIHLQPFTLAECDEYVRTHGLMFNRSQILQCYMIFGGVPFYWGFLQKGQSLAQNIDSIFFEENAPLKKEFQYLYASVFKNPTVHLKIIQALGRKKAGMTREEILCAANLENSGDITVKLEELENCGFIRKYYSYGRKKKSAVYQLIDCFTLFYFQFLENQPTDGHFWMNQINTPRMNTWLGLAFERVCLLHVRQIKQKLGISGVLTDVNSWYCGADSDKSVFGSQIDLLIVRKDQVINLCEMKYSDSEYTITEKTDRAIRRKISDFITVTGTRYAIHPTFVTPYGLVENSYSKNVQAVVTMEDLFAE